MLGLVGHVVDEVRSNIRRIGRGIPSPACLARHEHGEPPAVGLPRMNGGCSARVLAALRPHRPLPIPDVKVEGITAFLRRPLSGRRPRAMLYTRGLLQCTASRLMSGHSFAVQLSEEQATELKGSLASMEFPLPSNSTASHPTVSAPPSRKAT